MDGGGGCHVAAGSGGGGGGQDKTIINRIMLRFRPIAPKPVPGASSSGESLPENNNRSLYSPSKRVKRKYIRTKKSNRSYSIGDRNRGAMESTAFTLQLLPGETTGPGYRSWLGIDRPVEKINMGFTHHQQTTTWVNTMGALNSWAGRMDHQQAGSDRSSRLVVESPPVPAVESWVTVESVTETCMDVRGLGCTDEEKVRSLERDTCPGFISDDLNRVYWVNEAYKNMVRQLRQGQQSYSPEVKVWLVTKTELPGNGKPTFCCRVRLQHMWEKERCSKMVPCDVWRMQEGAGLAWRLDMKAALSLGL